MPRPPPSRWLRPRSLIRTCEYACILLCIWSSCLPPGSRARKLSSQAEPSSSELPKPRLDYRNLAENVEFKSHNAFNRKALLPVGALRNVARLYEEQTQLSRDISAKRHSQSTIGDRIRASASQPESKQALLDVARNLKAEIADLESRLKDVQSRLLPLALAIPNDTHPDVPIGPESDAKVIAQHGTTPLPASPSRDHVSVGRALNLLDLEAAATVTGNSWYYLLNEGALLELALVNYALSLAIKHGFTPVTTPDVVRPDIAARCGFQPRDQNISQTYHIAPTVAATDGSAKPHPELVLVGTAEIPLAGLFANKIFTSDDLPRKVVGLGHAFRAEAGARGADARGLYRVHQFTKLELFAVCTQESSEEMMEEMRRLQVEIVEGLGLSFRVLDMPTEELGASAYRKYDMEAWMPGRGSWGEISSTSNCTDYQARRLHIRYRASKPPPSTEASDNATERPVSNVFAHTLNGTAAAVPRLIIALLENGARFDEQGNVVGVDLPVALRPFWLGKNDGSMLRWV
ncbi:seryl-tRNA synthetase [Rhodofomes roseus]|uniref:serine--tRNA ligase n=1 Tax=Rhodofomes roseus TaxID=34475 RepID=A0ABQ8KE50_9APHY|nr:seryl-tRNA synthetase [Rhodofomes roseus]KAH9835909.1 seryl-tRNA synthetase [Rhodofomes roseus]